jgi:membrane fusion protein, multidrug efflux system
MTTRQDTTPTHLAHARFAAVAAAPVALALILGGVACGGSHTSAQSIRPPVPVTVATAERRTMPVTLKAIGHVEPIETVGIKARIGGELLKVSFAEGQMVHAGDPLFTIDPRPYQAALRQAEAQLARDQAQLAKAEQDIARYAGLVKEDFVTKEQYDQITTDAASLRAAVAADQAAIDNAKLQVSYCTIDSPIEGRTGNLAVKAGNLIKADADNAMVTINRTRPIYVTFAVPAQFLPAVLSHRAAGIKVLATPPEPGASAAEGSLTFIDNAVDTATSTILLKGTFANQDESLWPGQFVDVTVILGEEPNRVVVPAAAVQSGQQGQYVFVVKPDKTAELRPVKVNRMDEHDAVIDEGVQPGETVVTDGQLRLLPGSKVEIKGSAEGGKRT